MRNHPLTNQPTNQPINEQHFKANLSNNRTYLKDRGWSFTCTCLKWQTLPGGAGTSANHSHMSADTFCAGCEGVRPALQKSAQDKAPSALTHSPHCGWHQWHTVSAWSRKQDFTQLAIFSGELSYTEISRKILFITVITL